MELLQKFKDVLENRHTYATKWKERAGSKVIGYYDTYFPEELVYAAGVLPVRVLPRHEPDDVTDRLMYGNCYYTRDMFNNFIRGHYDYVDGIVCVEGCQWLYNAFDTTMQVRPELFSHYMFVPDFVDGRRSKDLMLSEMKIFKGRLEGWLDKEIIDSALDKAIAVYNEHRQLLRNLYELRRFDCPCLLGSEAMDVVLACQIMDKEDANRMLKELIPALQEREPSEDRIRLMLLGSETFDSNLERLIESLGGNVVIDELENGVGYFINDVAPLKNRLMAIGLRYLGKPHSALKDSVWRRRPDQIYRLYEDYQAEGVIIAKQIYCHPHGTDMYTVWKLLRERDIPFYTFERDTTLPIQDTTLGIEALIETIRPAVVRLEGWSKA